MFKNLFKPKLNFCLKFALGLSFFETIAYFYNKKFPNKHIDEFFKIQEGFIRGSRVFYNCAILAADYKFTLLFDDSPDSRKKVHQRSAERLLKLFEKNSALYIKIGQYLASLNNMLPIEYCNTLSVLQDRAPTISLDEVRKVIQEDFGKPIEELFSNFGNEPIAAASLAQVHKATTKNGKDVAVKIQYPIVRRYYDSDLMANDFIIYLAKKIFPGFDFTFLGEPMKTGLRAELDFHNEVANSKRAKKNLANRKDAYIPEVIDELTSSRVLTSEFIYGVKPTDISGIKKMGLNLSEVTEIIMDVFSEQIYFHGLVHADPHPGNLLVRKINGKPQIVILDHGLYEELSEETRKSYCQLWKGLVLKDDQLVQQHCSKIGIENYRLFAIIVLMRSYDDADVGLAGKMRSEDLQKFLKFMQTDMQEIVDILKKLPKEILFVLRNNNLLRSINQELGSPVNRFAIMARKAVQGIHSESNNGSFIGKIKSFLEKVKFEYYLKKAIVFQYLTTFYIRILSIFGNQDYQIIDDDATILPA